MQRIRVDNVRLNALEDEYEAGSDQGETLYHQSSGKSIKSISPRSGSHSQHPHQSSALYSLQSTQ